MLGQMNPTESSRPISRCFCKLASGEKKRYFVSLHPYNLQTQAAHCIFGYFCLPETHTMLLNNQELIQ